MIKKLHFFSICLLTTVIVHAQNYKEEEMIEIGTMHTMYSNILKEKRAYYIYLPEGYDNNPKVKFPVVYLLDAEINFHAYTGIQHMLSRARRGHGLVPKMIVVGVVNTNRTRDFTPTKAKELPQRFALNKKMLEDGGGAENFLNFIQNELRPLIQSSYRTTSFNSLIGHSLGGLFTIHVLLNHPSAFNAYLAIDPSFWWDDQIIFSVALEKLKSNDFLNATLYFTSSGNKQSSKKEIDFKQILSENAPKELKWRYNHYKNESHGSVIVPSEYDGLKFLFKDYF